MREHDLDTRANEYTEKRKERQRLTCKNVRSVINSTPGAFQGCGRGAVLVDINLKF